MFISKRSMLINYNMINESSLVRPNYDLKNKKFSIELHISPDRKLGIVQRIDNNYISWYSITDLNDEINGDIFDYLACRRLESYSNEVKALGIEKYNEIQNWYKCSIEKTDIEGMYWHTPFGHYYGEENKKDHGKFFAKDVQNFYDDLIKLCSFRICGGKYIETLKSYYEMLNSDEDEYYYCKMEPLISILRSESYLRLCPDIKIRDIYLKCMKQGSSLYNRYMTAVR